MPFLIWGVKILLMDEEQKQHYCNFLKFAEWRIALQQWFITAQQRSKEKEQSNLRTSFNCSEYYAVQL